MDNRFNQRFTMAFALPMRNAGHVGREIPNGDIPDADDLQTQEDIMKKIVATMLISVLSVPVRAQTDPATTRDKTRRGAIIGAVAGGVLGAVIGNNTGSGDAKRGAAVGTLAGAAVGAGVGVYMDRQERELRRIEGLDVERVGEDELNVVMRNEVLFDYDSAALRAESRSALQEMAGVFDRYERTTISVEGHTDSVGSDSYNRALSQRRADSVAYYLERMGLDRYRMDTVAWGESQPAASNASASGRQLNRRVEIKIRANG